MEPTALLGVRQRVHGGHLVPEVLIRWAHLPDHKATWESYETIDAQFPHFHLEDKVCLWGGGNHKPPICFTYVRRRFHGKDLASTGEQDGTVCRVMDLQKEEGAELAIRNDWVMKS